eukprot:TRINITY_DN46235_c0_g1_i1.p1 TRINITY_DN46235_c0_g1~~TRINITY_DN46235_c0_g1_i1.p1  ORF type:complete len:587 (-),score=155.27 TRINITY_DN46235_c0_g1_i1:57-1817(-)
MTSLAALSSRLALLLLLLLATLLEPLGRFAAAARPESFSQGGAVTAQSQAARQADEVPVGFGLLNPADLAAKKAGRQSRVAIDEVISSFAEEIPECSAHVYGGTGWGMPSGPEDTNIYGQDRELHVQADGMCLFAVFDGHGPRGHQVAADTRDILRRYFKLKAMKNPEQVLTALTNVAREVSATPGAADSGSTVAGALRLPAGDVVVFHAGDSRVVWYNDVGKVNGQTLDHDCEHHEEVKHLRQPCDGLYMVCSADHALMTTRSFGDARCADARTDRRFGTVEVQLVPADKAQWLVLGSDGIFGSIQRLQGGKAQQMGFTNEQALRYILDAVDRDSVKRRIEDMFRMGHTFSPKRVQIGGDAVNYFGSGDDQSMLVVRLMDKVSFDQERKALRVGPSGAELVARALAAAPRADAYTDSKRTMMLMTQAAASVKNGDYDGALANYSEALLSAGPSGAIRGQIWFDIGLVQTQKSNLSASAEAYEEAQKEFEEGNVLYSPMGLMLMSKLAELRHVQGDFKQELTAYRIVKKIHENTGTMDTVAGARALLGLAAAEAQVGSSKDATVAARRARDAIKQAPEFGIKPEDT